MKQIAYIILPFFALSQWSVAEPKNDEHKTESSPHTEAIQLVTSTQQDEIRKVEQNDWWHDVKERSWTVKRPFHPGTIDSTHMFIVTYRIDGQLVQSWLVDTRKKTVEVEKAKAADKK